MARVMVLCAGLGTRLRPLTEELPKPLVPVGDRSVLGHITARLRAAGFGEVVINTHHLPDAFATEIEQLQIGVRVVHEPRIRGTAGGLAGARTLLGPAPVLVWNGDILADPPVPMLLDQVDDGLCLAVVPRPVGEGTVGLGEGGHVVRLRGERFGDEVGGGDYVGVAAIGARALGELPDFGCLIGDVALPRLRRGGSLQTATAGSGFVDLGDLAGYLHANQRWLQQNGDAARVWCGPGARVADEVALVDTVVGAGAQVLGAGAVERCVLWPGARASAPLRDAVVTAAGRVVAA